MDVYLTDLTQVEPSAVKNYSVRLTPPDRARYNRITVPNRRLQFLVGRALIDTVCHQSPRLSEMGKPLIDNGFISLAHSGRWVVLAHDSAPVGIDIEDTLKPADFSKIARRFHWQLDGDTRASFYHHFTRAEALFKLGEKTRPVHHFFYSIDTFIICISTLNSKEKINFYQTIPFVKSTPFFPLFLSHEVQDDL